MLKLSWILVGKNRIKNSPTACLLQDASDMIEEDDDPYFAFGSGFRDLFRLLFRIVFRARTLDWRYVGSALRMHARKEFLLT